MRTGLAIPLLDLIRGGTEERPVSGSDIASQLSLAYIDCGKPLTSADVRELVNWLRAAGDPNHAKIASSGDGYWWEEDWAKMQGTIAHLSGRIERMAAARRGICRAFKRSEAQAEMVM